MKNLKSGEAVEATKQPKERTVQITVKMLKELGNNSVLMENFINAIEQSNLHAPIAWQVANAMTRQTEMFKQTEDVELA